MSAAMASAAACLRPSGAGKSGTPWARLMAPCLTARRVISRITDSVNFSMRRLRKRALRAVAVVDTIREYRKRGLGNCSWTPGVLRFNAEASLFDDCDGGAGGRVCGVDIRLALGEHQPLGAAQSAGRE